MTRVILRISRTDHREWRWKTVPTRIGVYTPLAKLLARQARLGTTQDGTRNKAENYSSISATNQHQLRQKMYE